MIEQYSKVAKAAATCLNECQQVLDEIKADDEFAGMLQGAFAVLETKHVLLRVPLTDVEDKVCFTPLPS